MCTHSQVILVSAEFQSRRLAGLPESVLQCVDIIFDVINKLLYGTRVTDDLHTLSVGIVAERERTRDTLCKFPVCVCVCVGGGGAKKAMSSGGFYRVNHVTS